MKRGEEILSEFLAEPPYLAVEIITRQTAIAAIESAQREAWNEAIDLAEAAVVAVLATESLALQDEARVGIRSLHREEE